MDQSIYQTELERAVNVRAWDHELLEMLPQSPRRVRTLEGESFTLRASLARVAVRSAACMVLYPDDADRYAPAVRRYEDAIEAERLHGLNTLAAFGELARLESENRVELAARAASDVRRVMRSAYSARFRGPRCRSRCRPGRSRTGRPAGRSNRAGRSSPPGEPEPALAGACRETVCPKLGALPVDACPRLPSEAAVPVLA
jgi:hypothetical protein